MTGIVSVEKFTITLGAGVASDSATLTKSQVVANCVPFISKRITTIASPTDNHSQTTVDLSFSGSTVVATTSDGSTRALVCEITVNEYDPGRSNVYSGTFDLTTGETTSSTESFTAVAAGKAFLNFTWLIDGAVATYAPAMIRGQFASLSTVDFNRSATGGAVNGHWWVVEDTAGDFDVDEVDITLATGATSGSNTAVGAVVMANTWTLGSWNVAPTDTDGSSQATIDCPLTSTTQMTIQRSSSGGVLDYTGYIIEFTDGGSTVQRGTITAQGATASQNVTLPTTLNDIDLSMVHNAGNVGCDRAGSFPGAASSDNSDCNCAWDFVDADTIRVQHITTGGEANNDISWEVLEIETTPPVTYKMEGITKDKDGVALGSCECYLFRVTAGIPTFIAYVLSNVTTGAYSFTGIVNNSAEYLVVAWKDDTPHVFDSTDYVLTPVVE